MSVVDLVVAGLVFGATALVWLLVVDGWRGFVHPVAVTNDDRLPPGTHAWGWRATSWVHRTTHRLYQLQLVLSVGCLVAAGVWWIVASAH
jgi:hypothetical protein